MKIHPVYIHTSRPGRSGQHMLTSARAPAPAFCTNLMRKICAYFCKKGVDKPGFAWYNMHRKREREMLKMNENIKAYLIGEYNRLAYTHHYVFGYIESGMVYGAVIDNGTDILPFITRIDRASSKNGGTLSLKYNPNKAMLAIIKARATKIVPIMTEDLLETLNAETKHNRGQIFEEKVAEIFKASRPEKMNAKFTDCGDIIMNGVHYQVKYLKATFTDERTIHKFGGR